MKKKLHVPILFSWLSLLNIVAGPIDWYYINVLPYLHLNLCIALYRVLRNTFTFKVVALTMITLQVALFILTVTGMVPSRVILIG